MRATIFLSLLLVLPIITLSQVEDFQSLNVQANNYIDKEDYNAALVCLEKALKIGTDNQTELIWTATLAGICARQTNDLNKAYSLFEIAIKNNCKDEDVFNKSLQIAEQLNDVEKQVSILLSARQNVDGSFQKNSTKLLYAYYNNQQFDKAIRVADELLAKDPDQIQVLKVKGFSLIKTEKVSEGIFVFNKLIANDPNNLDGLRQLGFVYYEQGNIIKDKALDDYNLLKKPTQVDYILFQQQYKKSWVDYRKALPYLEKSYQIEPNVGIKQAIFNMYSRMGDINKANKYR